MALVDTLFLYRNYTKKQLDDLLKAYPTLSNDELMDRVAVMFSNLKGTFVLPELMVAEANQPELTQRFKGFDADHQQAIEVFERLLLLHVDEPDESFKDGLSQFDGLLMTLFTPEYELLMREVQTHLDDIKSARVRAMLSKSHVDIPPEVFA